MVLFINDEFSPQEGDKTINELIEMLESMQPLPPVKYLPELGYASRTLAEAVASEGGKSDSKKTKRLPLEKRLKPIGTW